MPTHSRSITRDDIMPLALFEDFRAEKRSEILLAKRQRRLAIGPYATIMFESWDSMWWQVMEMLRVEKGGEEQVADELAAYNPMVPNGSELTATLFFEVDDPIRRAALLAALGGVEDHIFIQLGTQRIAAVAEGDVERTNADGKASAVHFLHFPFTDAQIAAWRGGGAAVMVGMDHPCYGHIAAMSATMRAMLARDFD